MKFNIGDTIVHKEFGNKMIVRYHYTVHYSGGYDKVNYKNEMILPPCYGINKKDKLLTVCCKDYIERDYIRR